MPHNILHKGQLSKYTWIGIVAITIIFIIWGIYQFTLLPNQPNTDIKTDRTTTKKPELTLAIRRKPELMKLVRTLYTSDAFINQLKEQEQHIQSKFKNADLVEQIILGREISLLKIKQNSHKQSYQEKITMLVDAYLSLANVNKQSYTEQYIATRKALLNGDTTPAYRLFTQTEKEGRAAKDRNAIDRAAEAAYQQGKIAHDNLDYQKAFLHYQRAVKYTPYNVQYLLNAGSLADNMALYSNAIDYYDAALHYLLKTKGKTSIDVRLLWNKLGNAWNSKGNYDQAIEYFGLALARDIITHGSTHINVAIDKNNLASAWENKEKYQTAIGFYNQALNIAKLKLTATHPTTLAISDNLEKLKNFIAVKK